ncbi:MAG: hypothetical protein ACD_12C00450G0005 [uncultured bacterium]|nr:MAG: hypothetical protein ACD_12C00450G0005 [uncultured bacterium]
MGIKADWLELREILFNFYKPNDGMFELLDMLKVRGYRNILLSDQTNEWWPALNQKWKIDSYFDYCIISAEIGINKPDERIYKLALEKSQASADSIVFIDDLEENLLPAEKLEFKTVLYQDTEQLKKDLIALKVI